MKRILLLSSGGFPKKFHESDIQLPNEVEKQKFYEKHIIQSINNFNPKLEICEIKYVKISDYFTNITFGIYAGVIVELEEYIYDYKVENQEDYAFLIEDDKKFLMKIDIYVFLTDKKQEGRNIISQIIYPELIDFMDAYYSSPCYDIANHPIYFLNIFIDDINAMSILKQIAGIINSNIKYIEVFKKNEKLKEIPKDLYQYLIIFENKDIDRNVKYENDFYQIDFINSNIKIKRSKLVVGEYLLLKDDQETLQFNGSSEKFYWSEVIPIVLIAVENDFEVDMQEIEEFYQMSKVKFQSNDIKMKRFLTMINYLRKILLKEKI